MQSNITHTAAEESLLAALSGSEKEAAEAAGKTIAQKGLPTRRVEAWHYTDLRSLLKNYPKAPTAINSEFASEGLDEMTELLEGYRLGFANTFHVEGYLDKAPEGVSVSGDQTFLPNPENIEIADDTIGNLNASLFENGLAITIEPKTKVKTPVILAHTLAGETATVLRHKVDVGEGAEALFIEQHHSSTIANHQNMVCNVTIQKGATLNWVIHQELGVETTRLAQLNVHLAEDAALNLFILNAGGKLVRQEVHIAVEGENSNVVIKGVNLIGEGAHIDVTTSLAHNVPNTNAEEIFRNVVTGRGKGVFQGQIRVGQPAQKTDAQMACNTLLLSDESDFSAKPELEIFADDVVCAHGATVTDIDENHLFYMRARGLREREARALLVKAFVEEIFEDLEIGGHEEKSGQLLGEALNARIENWLDLNG